MYIDDTYYEMNMKRKKKVRTMHQPLKIAENFKMHIKLNNAIKKRKKKKTRDAKRQYEQHISFC